MQRLTPQAYQALAAGRLQTGFGAQTSFQSSQECFSTNHQAVVGNWTKSPSLARQEVSSSFRWDQDARCDPCDPGSSLTVSTNDADVDHAVARGAFFVLWCVVAAPAFGCVPPEGTADCANGKYFDCDTELCTSCVPGQFAVAGNQTACTDCSAGQ